MIRKTLALALLLVAGTASAEDYRHFNKAMEAYRQQIYLSALSEARAQLRDTPSHAASWRLIARIYLTLKKCPEASAAAAAAYDLMIQPPLPTAEAQSEMGQILASLDSGCGASLELGRVYTQAKEYDRASAHYRGYLEKNPNDAGVRLEYAQNLAWARQYPAAAEQYKRYLRLRPKDAQAMIGLSDVYAWSGDLQAAATQLKRALAIDPGNAEAVSKLGRVYEWQGQYKAAKTEYDKAIALSPSNDSARDGQGRVKDLTADADKRRAFSSDDIVAEIQRTGEQALYFKLGEALYHNEGKVDDALRAYRRYLRNYPDDTAALLKVARVLGWEKRYDEAVPLFRQYLKKNPDDIAVHMELANILTWKESYPEALAELSIIKQKNASLPGAYLTAGNILRWQREYPAARDQYRKVLELDPDNVEAKNGLFEIDQQWTADPLLRVVGDRLAVSDIHFRRYTEGAQGEFHLNDGRIDITPGLRAYQFKQGADRMDAKEAYVNLGFPIQAEWRWWGGAGAMQIEDRSARLQGSLGIEGTISSQTWVRMGYTRQEAVFESNNLSALLDHQSLQVDSYDFQFSQAVLGKNYLKGVVSAGFLTDGNSRTRIRVDAVHELATAPLVTVGAAFKALTFAQDSAFYWSPSSYSGPGLEAQLVRHWRIISFKVGMELFRIIQTSQTEMMAEGGFYYLPRHGFFASLTAMSARGAGAAPEGTVNTVYEGVNLNAGYKF